MRIFLLLVSLFLSACTAGRFVRPTDALDPQKAVVVFGVRYSEPKTYNDPYVAFDFWQGIVANNRLEDAPDSSYFKLGSRFIVSSHDCPEPPLLLPARQMKVSTGVCFQVFEVEAKPFILYETRGGVDEPDLLVLRTGTLRGKSYTYLSQVPRPYQTFQNYGLNVRSGVRRAPEDILWLNLKPGEVRYLGVQVTATQAELARGRKLGDLVPVTAAETEELTRLIPRLAGRPIVRHGFDRESDLAPRQ